MYIVLESSNIELINNVMTINVYWLYRSLCTITQMAQMGDMEQLNNTIIILNIYTKSNKTYLHLQNIFRLPHNVFNSFNFLIVFVLK